MALKVILIYILMYFLKTPKQNGPEDLKILNFVYFGGKNQNYFSGKGMTNFMKNSSGNSAHLDYQPKSIKATHVITKFTIFWN
jgi:hypothetical protein